jgi:hypothetical protein
VICGSQSLFYDTGHTEQNKLQQLKGLKDGLRRRWTNLESGNGGAGGIRTLDTAFQPYNGLANRRLQPLGHSSASPCDRRADLCPRLMRASSRGNFPLILASGSAATRLAPGRLAKLPPGPAVAQAPMALPVRGSSPDSSCVFPWIASGSRPASSLRRLTRLSCQLCRRGAAFQSKRGLTVWASHPAAKADRR